MYHGVVKKANAAISVNHLGVNDFERHLNYLQKHFKIVSLSEIFESYRLKKTPSQLTIAITFDDGYENNYLNAFPVLQKLNIPATIFIAAQCLQNNDAILWYDLIDVFKNEIKFDEIDFSKIEIDATKKEKFAEIKSIGQLKSFFKTLNTLEKNTLLPLLISDEKIKRLKTNSNPEFWKMLNIKQMKEMSDSGLIEIGSHSVNHPNLDTISLDDLKMELSLSKQLLEGAIDKKVVSIAYPDGAYNNEVKKESIAAGYQNLLAVDYRLANDENDFNVLPRFCISNTTTFESNMISIHRSFSKTGF